MNEVATTEDMSREKVELIKQTVAKGATDLELQLFFHACKRTGLDPLMKQIHAVKRWSNEDKRYVMAIQTGIDGYRLIADRTGCYAGSDEPVFEMDAAGGNDGYPVKATVTVWKLVQGQRYPFTASARWSEYVQRTKEGGYNRFWREMGFGQLGKCAEALALRKAFPAELSGVYTHEEMVQADEPSKQQAYTSHKADAARKIAEIRQDPPAPTEAQPGSPPPDEPIPTEGAGPYTETDNPATEWLEKIRQATTQQQLNAIYKECPDELKQDIYKDYSTTMKQIGRK